MRNIIVMAGTAIGSVLSLLEQIKNQVEVTSHVICMNSDVKDIFIKSKFVDFSYKLDFKSNDLFYDEFKRWYNTKGFLEKPVMYFTTDTSCYLVNEHREWFESKFELCLASSNIVKTYTKKGLAETDAEKNGLTIPKSQTLDNEQDIDKIINSIDFPVIIKPKSTYENKRAHFKVKVLEKNDFIDSVKNYLKQGHSFLCQEYIPGGDETAYYYLFYRSKKGVVNSVVGRKLLQSPPSAGVMAKGSIEDNDDLSQQCERFLENISYNGIGGIEFKKYNDSYYFIEMSPRLEGFFKISTIANVPLGAISFNDLTNQNLDLKYKQVQGGVYMDFMSVVVPRIKQNSYGLLLSDLWSLLFNKNIHLNVYSKNDKNPFYAMLKNYLK